MIRMYQLRLSDLEYREGLGSVSAVSLRRTLFVLRTVCTRPKQGSDSRACGEENDDKSKLFFRAEDYECYQGAEQARDKT
jgi:hypothetical protein